MGSIPIVNNSTGLNRLFEQSPTLAIEDWEKGLTKEQLLEYKVPTKSRKVLLYQYWRDKIDCIRNTLI